MAIGVATGGHGDEPDGLILEELAGSEPTPEFAAMVAEEYGRLLDRLGDDGPSSSRSCRSLRERDMHKWTPGCSSS